MTADSTALAAVQIRRESESALFIAVYRSEHYGCGRQGGSFIPKEMSRLKDTLFITRRSFVS